MRIAVISDIHGNLVALEAVLGDVERQDPDAIWCGGDIAWGGPWPNDCIRRVREAGWPTVKGNTDVWVTGDPQTIDGTDARRGAEHLAEAHGVSEEDAAWLLNLPTGHSGPGSLLLVHGTPDSPFTAPPPTAPNADFEPYRDKATVVIYGHVHEAFAKRLAEGTIVVNPGSVGLPKDGDTASYLLVDLDGPGITMRHRRVAFDRRACIAEARRIGGPLADSFLAALGEPT